MGAGADAFEPIHTTDDRVEAELFRTTLESHDIEVQLQGFADAALLGASPAILPMTLAVRGDDRAAALALLAALQNPAAAETEPIPDQEPETPETGRPRAQRRPAHLAAGLSFVFPAGAHLYARRPWTAAVLAIGWVGVLVLAGAERSGVAAAGLSVLLIAADLVGGVLAARTHNRGLDVSRRRQVAIGAALVLGALGVSQGAAAIEAMRAARLRNEREALAYSCTARALTVTRQGDGQRFVSVRLLRVAEQGPLTFAGSDVRAAARLEADGPAEALLAPGQALAIGLRWVDDDTACRTGSLLGVPTQCWVDFTVTVRESAGGRVLAELQEDCALPP